MDFYNISDLALKNNGEYVIGSEDLHTHACYLIYGVLKPGEQGRILRPGRGHEEIICLVHGEAILHRDNRAYSLQKGQAFYITGEESCLMDNKGTEDAVYIIAGGHSEGHSH
jgi:uncharacterized cupin superfamily protein